jgi:hypothetical protein
MEEEEEEKEGGKTFEESSLRRGQFGMENVIAQH